MAKGLKIGYFRYFGIFPYVFTIESIQSIQMDILGNIGVRDDFCDFELQGSPGVSRTIRNMFIHDYNDVVSLWSR